MHQQVQAPPERLWELHEPGERHYTSSVETLRRYALSPDTVYVRISSKRDGSEAEFRVDGPDGRLVWHEVGVTLTPREIVSLNEICQHSFNRGKLSVSSTS